MIAAVQMPQFFRGELPVTVQVLQERMRESQEVSNKENAARNSRRRKGWGRWMRREAVMKKEGALTQFIDLRKTKKVRRTFADPPLSPRPRYSDFRQGWGKLRSYFDDQSLDNH